MNLVLQAGKGDKETAAEILRAVVVLNHGYLEDFLRNVALWLMPIAGEETLNRISLAGVTGRAEKFQLGKLAEHRTVGITFVLPVTRSELLKLCDPPKQERSRNAGRSSTSPPVPWTALL